MKHCLVVDDSDTIRAIACRMLEGFDFETSQAADGQQALERCRIRPPDAILLDWDMPVMSGLEALGGLQSNVASKPYIIYCTTENDPAAIACALAAGADDYLLKPFDRAELSAKLVKAGLA